MTRLIPNSIKAITASLISVLMLTTIPSPANADTSYDDYGNPFQHMVEVTPKPEELAAGWESIYKAYSSVYHKKWALTSRWLMYALREGGADQLLQSRFDISFLCKGLNQVASSRKEAVIAESSCEVQILQAMIQNVVGNREEAIDSLRRVVINNPTYPSIDYLKKKIRELEFEKSGSPWMTPPDVVQTGGNSKRYSKWTKNKIPLKVYIPSDAVALKVSGYRAGDSQILRYAFETWQKHSSGKIRFVYVPKKDRADITCAWVSDQKKLALEDAVGVCSRIADGRNHLLKAKIQILTFANKRKKSSSSFNQFRKNFLKEVCLHEVGHSLGLNHSPSTKDVMYAYAHWQPITILTQRDIMAMNSLYLTNLYEYISAALDAIAAGKVKEALLNFDKAIKTNPKDSQTRDAICVSLSNAGMNAIKKSDYATAINLLTKSQELASTSESSWIKSHVIKNLHYAYVKAGRAKDAQALESQDTSLQTIDLDTASFLNKYGLKRESLPYYEEALAKNPDDLAIREKFCFLLILLGRDELNKNNDDEAIALLKRAKSLLRTGMSEKIIDKVIANLRSAYFYTQRYREADQMINDAAKYKPPPPPEKKRTPKEDIEDLVAAAKIKNPDAWANATKKKTEYAKVKLAYEQYTDALRNFAKAIKVKPESNWASVFIARYKPNFKKKGPNPLANVYRLRHRLILLTDQNTVIDIECRLPFKKVEQ